MMRLFRTTGLLGLLLGLMLLPMGCSGSQGETASSPSPSADPTVDARAVQGSFATGPDGQFEMTGVCAGVYSGGSGDSDGHSDADTPRSGPAELSVDLFGPALIDGAKGDLELTLDIGEHTKVLDSSGAAVPRSAQATALFRRRSQWTATVRVEDDGQLTTLEMRELRRDEPLATPPLVTGLLAERAGGLVEVPGKPGDQYGKGGSTWIMMDEPVTLDGVPARISCSLMVGERSKVVTTPKRKGSTDELLIWVSEVVDDHEWQATARLRKDGTLVLAKLTASPSPVGVSVASGHLSGKRTQTLDLGEHELGEEVWVDWSVTGPEDERIQTDIDLDLIGVDGAESTGSGMRLDADGFCADDLLSERQLLARHVGPGRYHVYMTQNIKPDEVGLSVDFEVLTSK